MDSIPIYTNIKLIAFVNPNSGPGKARQIWNTISNTYLSIFLNYNMYSIISIILGYLYYVFLIEYAGLDIEVV